MAPFSENGLPGIGTRKASADHIPCRGNVNQLLSIWLESGYEILEYDLSNICDIRIVIRITGKNPLLPTWYNGIAGIVLTCYSVKGMLDLAFWGIWSTKRFCGKKICCHFSTLSTGKKKSFSEIHFPTPIHSYKTRKNTYIWKTMWSKEV